MYFLYRGGETLKVMAQLSPHAFELGSPFELLFASAATSPPTMTAATASPIRVKFDLDVGPVGRSLY